MFLALLAASTAVVKAPAFTLFELNTQAHGVSKDGRFTCGSYWNGKGWVVARWDEASMTYAAATAQEKDRERGVSVSDRGEVVVAVSITGPKGYDMFRGFLWSPGKELSAVRTLPGMDEAWPRSVSRDGMFFVGAIYSDKLNQAARWKRDGSVSKMPQLGNAPLSGEALNISDDGKVVVGHLTVGKNNHAVIWKDGKAIQLPDLLKEKQDSSAWACSRDGSVVAGFANDGQRMVPVIWPKSGGIKKLGEMPKAYKSGMARGMSDDGKTVVGLWGVGEQAFVWTESGGVAILGIFLRQKGLGSQIAGIKFRSATGISADGRTIVGICMDSKGHPRGFKARF